MFFAAIKHSAMRDKTSFRIATLVVFILVLGLQACAPAPDNKTTPVLSNQPNTTYPMPPIGGPRSFNQLGWVLSDSQHVTIGSYQNKVLVLDFYATWCQPCRKSVPLLLDLQKRYGPEGLSVVGLNVGGSQDLAEVPKFVAELKIDYPLGVPDQALTDLLMSDTDAIPQTFVFDRQGHLIKRYVGVFEASEIDELIKSALQTES
jgi:thiol-disulfide isomerase/thioredoxin